MSNVDKKLQQISRGLDPSSHIYVNELAKHFNVDEDDVRTRLATMMLSNSTAVANQYEEYIVNAVEDVVLNYRTLSKEVFLNQRLSDSEKSFLLREFSPPYKLHFSPNPSDIGSHMLYRSLNEIATFRCYDLLPSDENIAPGYHVLIKEVGASIPKLIKYKRKHVHACTPNLSVDDSIRITNTQLTMEQLMRTGDRETRRLTKQYNSDPIYRCSNKSQHCFIKSRYVVFAHSSYDCTLTDMANIMDSAEAVYATGFIHFSSKILSSLNHGSDNGLNWKIIEVKKEFYIEFWFDNDYQNSYTHHLDTYLGIISATICKSRKGNHYIVQRREVLGGLLFFSVLKPVVNIPRSHILRQIPFSDPDHIIVHYYRLQNDPSLYFYHELIPIRIVVPRLYFEKLYSYLELMPEGQFTVQNSIKMATTLANRTVVNGASVSQPFVIPIETVDNIAYACYFIVYCKRFDHLATLKTLKHYEDLKRNPTLWDRICILFSKLRNYMVGVKFDKFEMEKTFKDVLKNNAKEFNNDYMLSHTNNMFQWIMRFFRVSNRYDVKFFPVTRVVTIEEDIDTFKNVTNVLPLIADNAEDMRNHIRDILHITRVDMDKCTISDCVCSDKLVRVPNQFAEKCVLRCVANALTMSLSDVMDCLSSSSHLNVVAPSLRLSLSSYITGATAELEIFELIACEFSINVCLHLETKCVKYDVSAADTYHFEVKDNHCIELRPRCSVHPFDFGAPVSVFSTNIDERELQNEKLSFEREYSSLLSVAANRPKAEKFKLYPVVSDFKPYVCRSVLKLHEIDTFFGVLVPGRICELSAAPGSWIEYCSRSQSQGSIVYSHYDRGLDLVGAPDDAILLNEVTSGDLSDDASLLEIGNRIEKLGGLNVLLCDAAIMGSDDCVNVAAFTQYQDKVFSCVPAWLLDGGNMVFKTFADVPLSDVVCDVLKQFVSVNVVKPMFSSPISTEYYIVCKDFQHAQDASATAFELYPNMVKAKIIKVCKAFARNVFPRQIQYEMPRLYSYVAPVNPTVPSVNTPAVITPDPLVPESFDGKFSPKTFEYDFMKIYSKMNLSDVPFANFTVLQEALDVNPDVFVQMFDRQVMDPEGNNVDYVVHNGLGIRIDLAVIDTFTAFTYLSFVSNKLQGSRVRIYFDVSNLPANVSIEVVAFLKTEFSSHEVHVYSQHTDCSFSVSSYKKAIVEYVSYLRSVRHSNASTYKHYYNLFKNNLYVASHSFIAVLSKDTQNISVRFGSKSIFRHPNCRPEQYSHAYDGQDFVPISDINETTYYLVGEFTHRMFDGQVMDALTAVDVDRLANTQFVLVQGVAGHGKTREIVEKHVPKLKNNSVGDLILTPTKAGKGVLWDRTISKHGLDPNVLDKNYYRTITSFLIHKNVVSKHIFVDEVMMVHVAMVLACAYHAEADVVYLYGDTQQIPAHSALGDFKLNFNTPLSLFKVREVRNKSHRVPLDVCAVLSPMYLDAHTSFGFPVGLKSSSTVLRSLKLVKINAVSDMLQYINESSQYLTFTHTTEGELNKLSPKFKPMTIAAYQGSEHADIAIVRTSYSPADNIYNNEHICVTAITRHTKSLTYYTTCDLDVLSKWIKRSCSLTDLNIKTFGTSVNVGSFTTENSLVPTYVPPTTSKFFRSRKKYTAAYTLVDTRQFSTEKELVLHLATIDGDIFIDKSTFKRFAMSDILKWVRKLSVDIKYVYVRVQNESFSNDAGIQELVEEYKCSNVIMNVVTEHLETLPVPYEIPELSFPLEMSTRPCIESLQTFMCHLFPDSVFVNTDYDAHMVHTSDIMYTLSDVSFSPLWDQYTPKEWGFQTLRPVLSTPAPAIRDVTQREILLGIQKRNLNPPQLMTNSCPDASSDHLIQNFCNKIMIPKFDEVLSDMESIYPTTASITSWLERQDRSVMSSLINDIPFFLESLAHCSLSLKRNPKVRVTKDSIDIYDSVQTITYHPKHINAFFCSIVDSVQDRMMKLMNPWVKFFTKTTTADFGKTCYDVWRRYGKVYLFSGDDSLLINGYRFKEMDMSKFDKSQQLFALEFLCKLFRRFGVPPFVCSLYYEMMFFRICKDPVNKVTMFLTPQMESGSAATYLGNTCFCAAVMASCLDLVSYEYNPRFEKFSLMFNLETKEFDYKNPYFCSKFLVMTDDTFVFYPDPAKLLIKLGRKDLKNFSHMKEFHASLMDLISQYSNYADLETVSNAIRERYHFPYDCSEHIRNLVSVIKDYSVFRQLYFTTPDDRLDLKCVKFSDY